MSDQGFASRTTGKTGGKTTATQSQHGSAGENAIALAPPRYGIDFVDNRLTATAPVQCVTRPEEDEPLQGKFGAAAPAFNRTGMPDQLKAGIEALSAMDMSDVRVHADSPQPARIGALAYAQGNDIHLAPGQERHLPHEAWHVVQQREGRVRPTLRTNGMRVNDDAHLEREADRMGQSANQPHREGLRTDMGPGHDSVGVAEGVLPAGGQHRSSTPTVQRYQAGITGHETETGALREIGFTEDEAEKVYIGNWLRDFSQLIAFDASYKSRAKKVLVPIIGRGEFGESFTLDDLGVYVPSEHMDNPLGGATLEDPLVKAKDTSHLSSRQKDTQSALDSRAPGYEAAAKTAGLPGYIGRSKANASYTLKAAYRAPERDNGLRLMGEALHAVEDYFAHTNFTEIAIWTLAQEGNKKAAAALARTGAMETIGGMDELGRPRLLAGTYKPGGNDTVSLLETLKTQLNTKQFIYATLKGLIRTGAIGHGMVTSALAQYGIGVPAGVIAGAGGAIGGGAAGAVEGAGKGMDEGARSGEATGFSAGYSMLGEYGGRQLGGELAAIGHYLGAAEGLVGGGLSGGWKGIKSGAKEGWKAGFEQVGGAAGRGAAAGSKLLGEAAIVGGKIVITYEVAALLMTNPVIAAPVFAVLASIHALVDQVLEKMIRDATAKAAEQSPEDPDAGKQFKQSKRTVTHSEIAKDSPDNPMLKPSAALMNEAVKGVGRVMHSAWKSSVSPAAVDVQIDAALDKYVCIPSADPWWRERLKSEL